MEQVAMPQRTDYSRMVYTTDPDAESSPPAASPTDPSARQQTARIVRDRKRRADKTVTIISGLRHDPATLQALLTTLKQRCGPGGALKEGELESQGKHREQVVAVLAALGEQIKYIGG
jgi:translation initiation factor 1